MLWGPGTPSKWDLCGVLAHTLLEGQSGNSNKIMHDHAQKRLHLLATQGARKGPDASYTPVYLHSETSRRRTTVLVLESWLKDTTKEFTYSVHSMLERAAMRCSYTPPGDYLTLEPFTFARAPELGRQFPDRETGEPRSGSVHKMLMHFNVPLHEKKCRLRDEVTELGPMASKT